MGIDEISLMLHVQVEDEEEQKNSDNIRHQMTSLKAFLRNKSFVVVSREVLERVDTMTS